jgi:quinol monooxygenase YgiN
MIIEIVRIFVPRKRKQEFGRALASLIGPIQVQQGCLNCRVSESCDGEEFLQVEARWENRADLILHLRSDVYKQLLLLMELGTAPPVMEFFTVVEIRGLDLVEDAFSSAN